MKCLLVLKIRWCGLLLGGVGMNVGLVVCSGCLVCFGV